MTGEFTIPRRGWFPGDGSRSGASATYRGLLTLAARLTSFGATGRSRAGVAWCSRGHPASVQVAK